MKNSIRYIIHNTGVLLLLIAAWMATSCEELNTAPPEISNIRLLDPELADEPIDGAGLNTWLVIEGSNLAAVNEVYLNDMLADFNPTLMTETTIILQIPGETPNLGTDSMLPNTVRVVSQYGEAIYENFLIYAPPAVIEALSCEFALPGDTLLIEGDYFFGVDSVVFPGNLSAEILDESADGSACTVVVPEGATESGAIRVVTLGGTSETGSFRIAENVIANFDNINPFQNWGGTIETAASSPVPVVAGNYFMATILNAVGTYWVQESAMPMRLTLPNITDAGKFEEISLKFEFYAEGTWDIGIYVIDFVELEVDDADGDGTAEEWLNEYRYEFTPWDTEDGAIVYSTHGRWITVEIPLSEFIHNNANLKDYSQLSSVNYMQNVFINPDASHAVEDLKLGFDNLRIWYPTE
ncbi:MAG: hypothetical protein JW801_07410 [Bacteroidales bacterium]|nr:hypothetical protein [Bacteroidales bacterium]